MTVRPRPFRRVTPFGIVIVRLGPAATLEDSLWEALKDPQCGLSMAETAENLAERYGISRERVRQIEVRAFEKLQKAMKAAVAAQRAKAAIAAG